MEEFNILVCDDDKSIVDAIEIYLKQEGYNVIKAYNGLEALQALEENEIHLILLDIMMPQMDGLQATVKIRENLNIPIIILSAKSEDTDKILGLNFGADDYITKPFSPSLLMARVEAVLRRFGKDTQNDIVAGLLSINATTRTVYLSGKELELTR
ncbi:MAG: response regulator transcription factor, partial [Anaerotignum sp.]|nr:response regulator transcription factor [Anaerotignum sp.]